MFKKILIALIILSNTASADNLRKQGKEAAPVLHEVSNKDVVQSIYPDAAKVEKVNNYWYKILDNNDKLLGFAMSSLPYCKNVKGYNNTTPVMILTDEKWVITKVSILTNWETLGYVKKLERRGFFDLWVGKTLKEAKTVRPDGYSGATYTALAVSKNVDFLLNNGVNKLPKK